MQSLRGPMFFFEDIFSEINSCKFCEQLLVFLGSCDQQPSWKLMYLATAHLSTKGVQKKLRDA